MEGSKAHPVNLCTPPASPVPPKAPLSPERQAFSDFLTSVMEEEEEDDEEVDEDEVAVALEHLYTPPKRKHQREEKEEEGEKDTRKRAVCVHPRWLRSLIHPSFLPDMPFPVPLHRALAVGPELERCVRGKNRTMLHACKRLRRWAHRQNMAKDTEDYRRVSWLARHRIEFLLHFK